MSVSAERLEEHLAQTIFTRAQVDAIRLEQSRTGAFFDEAAVDLGLCDDAAISRGQSTAHHAPERLDTLTRAAVRRPLAWGLGILPTRLPSGDYDAGRLTILAPFPLHRKLEHFLSRMTGFGAFDVYLAPRSALERALVRHYPPDPRGDFRPSRRTREALRSASSALLRSYPSRWMELTIALASELRGSTPTSMRAQFLADLTRALDSTDPENASSVLAELSHAYASAGAGAPPQSGDDILCLQVRLLASAVVAGELTERDLDWLPIHRRR